MLSKLYIICKDKFGEKIKILRSDHGTEYTNKEFASFLST